MTFICGQAIHSIGSPAIASGCLVAFEGHEDRVMLLTAGHGVVARTARQFDPIEAEDAPLGKLVSWTGLSGPTTTDAALVWVDPGRVSPAIQGIGVPIGVNRAPVVGSVLRVFAPALDGVSRQGAITAIGASVTVHLRGPDWLESVGYQNQILCNSFTDPDDVGAVALDQEGAVVGLVAGQAGAAGDSVTVITPIAAVLEHQDWQGLTLNIVTAIPANAVPPAAAAPPHLSAAMVGAPQVAKDVLARTLWAEDRGAGGAGMTAVAAVILNRLRSGQAARFGGSIEEVCKKKAQFSCWNPGPNVNRDCMLAVTEADASFLTALQIADDAIAGRLVDPTGGARHYVAQSLLNSVCRVSSGTHWYCRVPERDQTLIIDQTYFRNVA